MRVCSMTRESLAANLTSSRCYVSSRPEDTRSAAYTLRRPQLILSLYDYSGVWSQPYVDDGYDVIRVDLKHGEDVRLMELPKCPVHGILAAPPCTVFANSGARWERSNVAMIEGLSTVDAVCRLVVA